LEDAERVQKLTRFDPEKKHLGECGYGLALTYSDDYEQQLQGIAMIETWMATYRGRLVYVFVAPLLVQALMRIGLYGRAIEIADSAIESLRKCGLGLPLFLPEVSL
jgi:hypothetical protein